MTAIKISPSILAADVGQLASQIKLAEEAGADWHHIDVMDGHFVPNLSYGLPIVKRLKQLATIPLDVHIMVSNPDQVAKQYVKAGADILSFHLEAALHPHRIIQEIQELGARACVALNPGTPAQLLDSLLSSLDGVLLMSVNPGFGGQRYLPVIEDKARYLKTKLTEIGRSDEVFIEVDGGIGVKTIGSAFESGCDTFVAGSAVYGQEDIKAAINDLRAALP